jgi:hypothetical protein
MLEDEMKHNWHYANERNPIKQTKNMQMGLRAKALVSRQRQKHT